MKIVYPRKKKKQSINISKRWMYMLAPLIAVSIFFGGMLFYRNGYASAVWVKFRNIFIVSNTLSEAKAEVTEELNDELKLYQANGLPTVFLDIPFDSMMQIESKREKALRVGVLFSSDEDYVPASIRYNDEQNIDVEIRLKGDWVDHLKTEKWSFRIHVKEDDGAVLGMRRFSLQGPETRNYVNEWGYHQNLMMEGVLTTRYYFVNVVINGEHKGIYALEESFAEDLIESQNRREGVIIRMNEDYLWKNWATFSKGGDLVSARNAGFFWLSENYLSSEITPFRGSRIAGNETLSEEFETATELLYSLYQGTLPASQVIDEELWGKYYAITDLWYAGHSTAWHNLRFYYNPVTGLLEPVAFDGDTAPQYGKESLVSLFTSSPTFQSPGVQEAYIKTLERITDRQYVNMLQESFGKEMVDYHYLLVKEYESQGVSDNLLKLPWQDLEFRRDVLSRNLSPAQPVRGNYHVVSFNNEGNGGLKVELVNMMVVPVKINDLQIGNHVMSFQQEWCADEACYSMLASDKNETIMLSGRENNFQAVSFFIPKNDVVDEEISPGDVSVRVNLNGVSRDWDVPLSSNYVPQGIDTGVKPSVTLEDALASHPFLVLLDDDLLAIEPGDWSVTGDLILPDGYSLLVLPRVTLRFEEDSVFLVVHGSVDIRGVEGAPVLLTAQDQTWGGMVVLNADKTSTWQYVTMEKMGGISRSGWILTGGVTFYESDADLSFSRFGNSYTEDALNIIRSSFSFEYIEFFNTPSDAFDGDFVNGTVSNTSFHDIVGDAFDVSGSEATIADSYFVNVGDKAISAGENSDLIVDNITVRNVSIGVSSKDLSSVVIRSSSIDNASIAGLAAYIKKPQYGAASITAKGVEITNTSRIALCQTDNELYLNGESVPEVDIDVDALYEQGILGN